MAEPRREIRFLLNGTEITLSKVGASDTLLNWLRLNQQLTGTKEGCAEGDCGACTVLVGKRIKKELRYEAINACIRPLVSIDLCDVITVEHIRSSIGGLHPIQASLVEHHASQCGFCTPGIVMSLYALWMDNPKPSRQDVEVALQGNLCRCTGYRPIVDAALAALQTDDLLVQKRNAVLAQLNRLDDRARVEVTNGLDRAILPADLEDLIAVLDEEPKATIVAGATDVGLWVTKHMQDISPGVFIGNLHELKEITQSDDGLRIGAGVTYTEAESAINNHVPGLETFWKRIGGGQVRNAGTIGGNIANGSPIGDTPPVLISLSATIGLCSASDRREIPLEDFFIAYGKQDLREGEIVEFISIPKVPQNSITGFYKLSKRRDEDISSVCAAFFVTVENGRVVTCRLTFGGMAAIPKRATKAEAALRGQEWNADSISAAKNALAEDFKPLSDWRASADYRSLAAANLLERFWLESQGKTAKLTREVV